MTLQGYYVHDLDPILLRLGGPLAIRWYGLAYLAGFVAAWWLLVRLSRRGLSTLREDEVSNFIVAIGLGGVLVGGRLGYMLFYAGQELWQHPLSLFAVWDGGMASHGGMLGVAAVLLWYALRRGHPLWNLADNLCCVAPVGLFCGRLANFINGELWGRPTHVPWAVIFPTEAGYAAGTRLPPALLQHLLDAGHLAPRHPSQLYEAAAEGLLLFSVLWWLRTRPRVIAPGRLTATFLALYATVRIAAEFFREPDAGSTLFFGWMTKGQLLSCFMYAAALAVLWGSRRWGTRGPLDA